MPTPTDPDTSRSSVERVSYEFLPPALGPYVHATKHSRQLFVSGLLADGSKDSMRSIATQLESILSSLQKILDFEGKAQKDIVKVTIYLTDITALKEVREVLSVFYGGFFPACTAVEVSGLVDKNACIEIDAIVALG